MHLRIKHKWLVFCALLLAGVSSQGLSQRLSLAENQPGDGAVKTDSASADAAPEVRDTVQPEGEIEDPLAPVREQAGMRGTAFGPDRTQMAKTDEWSVEVAAEYGYVWGASLSKGLGTATEQSGVIGLIGSKRLDEGCVGIVGANWQTFSFGFGGPMPLPNNLQGLNAIFGADFEVSEDWYMRIQLEPGVYGTWNNITWHNVNMPTVFAWTNIINEEFQWFIALRADVFQFFPVLPVPGIRWQPTRELLFNLSAPKPTVNYAVTDSVSVFGGGQILGITARLPENDTGSLGNRSLAGALINYFEARVGAGVTWRVADGVSLQGEAGALVWRTFDLPRLNDSVRSTMAPYVQIAVRGQF